MSRVDDVYEIVDAADRKLVRQQLLQVDCNDTSQDCGSQANLRDSRNNGDDNDNDDVDDDDGDDDNVNGNLSNLPTNSQQTNKQQFDFGTNKFQESRLALCRMNLSSNARRQIRFSDQKLVMIEGHYCGYLPLLSRPEPVFVATCRPLAMPEARDCSSLQGSTNSFTTIHSLDMKILSVDSM